MSGLQPAVGRTTLDDLAPAEFLDPTGFLDATTRVARTAELEAGDRLTPYTRSARPYRSLAPSRRGILGTVTRSELRGSRPTMLRFVVSETPNQNRPIDEPTELLHRVARGDTTAIEHLLPLVYSELRARAGAYFRSQPSDHTLQPTALVHEAYIKVIRASAADWRSKAHFCAVAATAMRQILIDHARKRAAEARARNAAAEAITNIESPTDDAALDLLALDEVLATLWSLDERQARLVELRYFGGISNKDVAEVLGVSERTVEREWRRVRAWLLQQMDRQESP